MKTISRVEDEGLDRPLLLFHVEDSTQVDRIIRTELKGARFDVDLKTYLQTNTEAPVEEWDLPRGPEWDGFDCALLDLELYPLGTRVPVHEELQGGHQVLPLIRTEAPWLPAVGYSRLLERTAAARNLPLISVFGFDGIAGRDYLCDRNEIDQTVAARLFVSTDVRRWQAGLGPAGAAYQETPHVAIECGTDTAAALDAIEMRWRNVIARLFPFAERVYLSLMSQGWSGATALHAHTVGSTQLARAEGEWFVKVSPSPWKLNREVKAHHRMQWAGLPFARSAPLLWPSVVATRRLSTYGYIGAVAYQMAPNTVNGLQFIQTAQLDARFGGRLLELLQPLYRVPRIERTMLARAMRKWLPSADALVDCAGRIAGCVETVQRLEQLANGREVGVLAKDLGLRTTIVHGDLHLGNVLFGASPNPQDVLVDFDQSGEGAVAVDLARLGADLLVRAPALRPASLKVAARSIQEVCPPLGSLERLLQLGSEDVEAFQHFLWLRLPQYLRHSNIDESTKDWIRASLP